MVALKILLPVLVILAFTFGAVMVIRAAARASQRLVDSKSLLASAAQIMAALGPGPSIEDSDVLTERSRTRINNWLKRYQKEVS